MSIPDPIARFAKAIMPAVAGVVGAVVLVARGDVDAALVWLGALGLTTAGVAGVRNRES